MITGRIEINRDGWTEIGGGATRLQFSAHKSGGTYVHFSESEAPPDSTVGCHLFGSWQNGFDFDQAGYPEGQKIWARSVAESDVLCITRDTNFFFSFIPLGSDSMTTFDGATFKVLGNG